MANTVPAALKAQVWAKMAVKRANNKSIIMGRYASESPNSIIQIKNDFTKKKGDKLNFFLQPRIDARTTDGTYADAAGTKLNDAALEGNEVDLTLYEDQVQIGQRRCAVKDDGRFFLQQVSMDWKEVSLEAISTWVAEDIDWHCIDQLTDPADAGVNALSHSASRVVYAANRANIAAITAADILDLDTIGRAKMTAKKARIRPINWNGSKLFLLLCQPEALNDLMTQYSSSAQTWYDTMMRAHIRGNANPIFKGAAGIVNGVILAEHPDIHLGKAWGAGAIRGTKNLFLGAQAALWGWAMKSWWIEKRFEYDNELGIASGYMAGCKRSTFNSIESGCLGVYTACTGSGDWA